MVEIQLNEHLKILLVVVIVIYDEDRRDLEQGNAFIYLLFWI